MPERLERWTRPLIITGMPRSGTSVLRRLCNAHPQMVVTAEFGNYQFVGRSLIPYAIGVADRVRRVNGRWPIHDRGRRPARSTLDRAYLRAKYSLGNGTLAVTHVLRVARGGIGTIGISRIAAAAPRTSYETRIVGDKLPQYMNGMDQFVQQPDLLRLVIYRDCRDVASSFLRKLRGDWKTRRWARKPDMTVRLAEKWVRSIETMEEYAERLFLVRYEDLVRRPEIELRRLAEWLGVDPGGFHSEFVFGSSVGNYHRGLTPEQLEDVLRVAGPTLERLGYSLEDPSVAPKEGG